MPLPTEGGTIRFDDPAIDRGYAFNPTVFGQADQVVCLFRHVDEDGGRHVYRCRLDPRTFAGTALVNWSDEVRARAPRIEWVADPRAFTLQDRRFVAFNTGHTERPNNIYVVEVDGDGRPAAAPLKVMLASNRRLIEKNWGFFEHDGALFAIYSLSPLVVLRCVLEPDGVWCERAFTHAWNSEHLEEAFGPLHGGTSPVCIDHRLVTVFQSRVQTASGFSYTGNLLELQAEPPFAPVAVGSVPLFVPDDAEKNRQPVTRLNPRVASVFYPAGLLHEPETRSVLLTYGINDFKSGCRRYRQDELFNHLTPVNLRTSRWTATLEGMRSDGPSPLSPEAHANSLIRTFYWRAAQTDRPSAEALSAGHFLIGNVGDTLQTHVMSALFGRRTVHVEREGCRLLGAGSIAHRALAGDVIWGSGFKDVPLSISKADKATIDVRAVRGPLTAAYLKRQGVDVSRVTHFFDPGALIGELFPAQVAACRSLAGPPRGILLIPHYKDTVAFFDRFGGRGHAIRTVDCDLFTMVRDILAAELVISSSLHGVIIAEALGVPAVLLRPPHTEAFAKYEDYYQGTGRHTFPVIDDPAEAASARVPELPPVPRGWRDTIFDLDQGPATRVLEAVYALNDAPLSPAGQDAGQSWCGNLDIGRFAGDHFRLHLDLAGLPARILVSARDRVLHDVTRQTIDGPRLSLGIDGQLVEACGGLLRICVSRIDGAGPPASIRCVKADF